MGTHARVFSLKEAFEWSEISSPVSGAVNAKCESVLWYPLRMTWVKDRSIAQPCRVSLCNTHKYE